ncbi:MAG: ATP-binding protein [Oscillospiraceae bacterium]|nr:ATP-binding protein [Oscillospiraceae bacterium]
MTYNNNLSIAKDTVMETARICAGLYSDDIDVSAFVKVGGDTRITVISPDGKVLADSRPLDVGAVENHLDRPEIQAAINNSPEAHVRYSSTLGVDFIYYALRVDSGDSYVFIRAAVPVAKVDGYLFQSLPLLVLLLVIIAGLCFAISRGMIQRITKPFESIEQKLNLLLSGGHTSEPVAKSYDEIDTITRGIDEVAQVLQSTIISLRDEKSKAEYILNNIGDGIFAVDESKNIMLINASALAIFDVTPDIIEKSMSCLSYDKALTAAVDDCVIGEKSSLFEFAFNGRIYFVTVKRLPETKFTMAVLSDITDSRENEKRREDFFANASHELKTPLTAIKGFNELTAINNKDESINKYIESITRETDRMLSLIGDMLKLSELEQRDAAPNGVCGRGTEVSLKAVANEVCETLSAAINEKSITVDIIGDGTVDAEPGHVYELMKNLIENAVRYNNQDGNVTADITSACLTVSDTGIGISPGEQTRIFERFYRVEKSRSQRSGGTGLGLSIIKHICALYGWELSMKSKLGVGTEIKVAFGKR